MFTARCSQKDVFLWSKDALRQTTAAVGCNYMTYTVYNIPRFLYSQRPLNTPLFAVVQNTHRLRRRNYLNIVILYNI